MEVCGVWSVGRTIASKPRCLMSTPSERGCSNPQTDTPDTPSDTPTDEAVAIVDRIKQLVEEEGVDPSDMAVLFRWVEKSVCGLHALINHTRVIPLS